MEMVITVQTQEIPANWKTAEECHAIAVDWKNTEIKNCVNVIMEKIVSTAKKGGIYASVAVSGGRPEYFYKVLEDVMTSLGYSVKVPGAPHLGNNSMWVFTW